MFRWIIACLLIKSIPTFAQNDTTIVRKIYENAYTSKQAQKQLKYLCKQTPGRLVGSKASEKAVKHMFAQMQALNLDSVWLQPFKAPCWRSVRAKASLILQNKEELNLNICTLGASISTPKKGITANIIEVQDFEHLNLLGREAIENKIVFFNASMVDSGYGKTVKYRTSGAVKASELGAKAVIIRSLTNRDDDFPHTGSMHYEEGIEPIPAVMISTNDANLLNHQLHSNKNVELKLKVKTKLCDSVTTWNVIGEIKGTKNPDEIILAGAHIDAWFNTEGAHDDGTGCVQALDVLRIFKELNIKPQHTIRAVLFMDEEFRQTGSVAYAKQFKTDKNKHLVAIESDAGAFKPQAFGVNASPEILNNLRTFEPYFSPYYPLKFKNGYGGVDIMPLKVNGTPLIGFEPDGKDYFHYHHCAYDSYEKVNYHYLQAGAASITTLIYLIDTYGLD